MKTQSIANSTRTTTTTPKATLSASENIDENKIVNDAVDTADTEEPDTIASRIRFIRTKAGLSQQQFADRLMVTRAAVSKWENGSGIPSVDSCQIIAREFDVSCDYILMNSDIPEPRARKSFLRIWKPETRFWRGFSKLSFIVAIMGLWILYWIFAAIDQVGAVVVPSVAADVGALALIIVGWGALSWGYLDEKWKVLATIRTTGAGCFLMIVASAGMSMLNPTPARTYPDEMIGALTILGVLVVVFYAVCILIGVYRIKRDRKLAAAEGIVEDTQISDTTADA